MSLETNELLDKIIYLRDKLGMQWKEIAEELNKSLGLDYTLSKYKSQYLRWVAKTSPLVAFDDNYIEKRKEAEKSRDILTQANAYIRRLSREDSIKEIAKSCAESMSNKKLLPVYFDPEIKHGDRKAILCISDWHYGMEFTNYWNTFNTEIAKKRIVELRDRVIELCMRNHVSNLLVINLSDLIAGRIHSQIRYQSRIDVITQTIEVSEILAEFLTDLSKYVKVDYHDTLDNHSRLEPNKSDSLNLESLVRITTWYLRERLSNTNITIHENLFGENIASFSVLGHKVCAVHGHHDKPDSIIKNLTLMTQEHWDLILTAHRHHFSSDETNECLVVSNGSLMGTDDYAVNLRLSSKPSQNLIIVSDDNPAEAIYRIVLSD